MHPTRGSVCAREKIAHEGRSARRNHLEVTGWKPVLRHTGWKPVPLPTVTTVPIVTPGLPANFGMLMESARSPGRFMPMMKG
jgi:hypothetical protein